MAEPNYSENSPTALDPETRTILGGYASHFMTNGYDAFKSLVSSLITLSGGAIAVSITFIEKLASEPVREPYMLIAAWVSFAFCLVLNLLTYAAFVSQAAAAARATYISILGHPLKDYVAESQGRRELSLWNVLTESAPEPTLPPLLDAKRDTSSLSWAVPFLLGASILALFVGIFLLAGFTYENLA
jgi:hypothetical protein